MSGRLKGYVPSDGEHLAVISYEKGRTFIPQNDGTLKVERRSERVVGADEAKLLVGRGQSFYESVLGKLESLNGRIEKLWKNGAATLNDAFTLSAFGGPDNQPALTLDSALSNSLRQGPR